MKRGLAIYTMCAKHQNIKTHQPSVVVPSEGAAQEALAPAQRVEHHGGVAAELLVQGRDPHEGHHALPADRRASGPITESLVSHHFHSIAVTFLSATWYTDHCLLFGVAVFQ